MAIDRHQPIALSQDSLSTARELAWRAVEDCLANGPVALGMVVSRIDGAFTDMATAPSVSAYLQEMVRSGRVSLVNDGRRWTVSAVSKDRLVPFHRIRQWLGRFRQ